VAPPVDRRAFSGPVSLPALAIIRQAVALLQFQQNSWPSANVPRTAHASQGRLIPILPPKVPPHGTPPPTRVTVPDAPEPAVSRGPRLPTKPLTCSFRWNTIEGGSPDRCRKTLLTWEPPYGIEP
jgi:hypothetical protein